MSHAVGGSEGVRKYWGNFLQDTDLLVFVVDAADMNNLSLAVKEIKTLLGDDRLVGVPILVLANKQVSF
jgi:GTPase SAR1 family protein